MKLTNKVVEAVIVEVSGEDTLSLLKALKNKKNVSEFKLADDIDMEINQTRNMLYRLYHANLVSFIRRKDKKKGWYIYYWTFNMKQVKFLAQNLAKSKIEKIKERLDREKSSVFYSCPNKCIRLSFDQAVDFDYKCVECGTILEQEDNTKTVDALEKELKQLESEVNKKK